MQQKEVLFIAPGSGLGHVVRSAAIAIELLKTPDVIPHIISSSQYSQGLSRLAGVKITRLSLKEWDKKIIRVIDELNPRVVICDTFPFGINGELAVNKDLLNRTVYIARHLKYESYFENKGITKCNTAALTIGIEPLQEQHQEWVNSGNGKVVTTDSPIRFPAELFQVPIPQQLENYFKLKPIDLIVHSGPKHELEKLAEHTTKDQSLIISPKPVLDGYRWFEYFPASNLFKYANKIITGAGYNAMSELAGYKQKHIAVAFDRNYDDQYARTNFAISSGNSNKQVAEQIMELVRD